MRLRWTTGRVGWATSEVGWTTFEFCCTIAKIHWTTRSTIITELQSRFGWTALQFILLQNENRRPIQDDEAAAFSYGIAGSGGKCRVVWQLV